MLDGRLSSTTVLKGIRGQCVKGSFARLYIPYSYINDHVQIETNKASLKHFTNSILKFGKLNLLCL